MKKTLLVAVMLMLPGAASAHAMLDLAQPSAGMVLHDPPHQIHLEFSERLEPAFSDVTVEDANGNGVTDGAPVIAGAAMTVKLRISGKGTFRVHWTAVSVDTHRTEGSYSFSVEP